MIQRIFSKDVSLGMKIRKRDGKFYTINRIEYYDGSKQELVKMGFVETAKTLRAKLDTLQYLYVPDMLPVQKRPVITDIESKLFIYFRNIHQFRHGSDFCSKCETITPFTERCKKCGEYMKPKTIRKKLSTVCID